MKKSEIKRKTPLKAKTALKRTGIKPKPKRKRKTALQKRIDKMDSKYWNNKCAAAVKAYFHTQACLVCGRREPEVILVCGHHNIFKSMSRYYRWDPMNIVPLCSNINTGHHLYDEDICPHRQDLPLTIANYAKILAAELPEYYDWWIVHEQERRHMRLMEGPKQRPDWRAQAEYWANRLEN